MKCRVFQPAWLPQVWSFWDRLSPMGDAGVVAPAAACTTAAG